MMIRRKRVLVVSLSLVAAFVCLPRSSSAVEASKLNVLFIAVDDLRPQTGCYGDPIAKTPSIDRLASHGVVFTRAYCQQAVCSPSRTSLLTGRRPDTTRIYDLQTHFRKNLPDVVTLPQYFKQHGYHTQGLSKIFHGGLDDPQSWSVPHWTPSAAQYGDEDTLAALAEKRRKNRAAGKREGQPAVEVDRTTGTVLKRARLGNQVRGPAWEAPDVPDNALPDGQTADHAIGVLRDIKGKPFFLAVGFLKPHLPFVAPKKYYDLYPPEQIRPADNPYPPKDVPALALTDWGELRAYEGVPKRGAVPDKQALELIRGYYAASTYTDTQIGRVLDELGKLGLRDNTIVILWGDHGWQLGEHGLWCKHTNFELATRSLLVLSPPRCAAAGKKTSALVEFVDIYPTLCELCGLPIPDGLEGTSMAPLLKAPDQPWKVAAFSQYPRGKVMGYSMRTDRYRYTEWAEPGNEPVGVELYDHKTDPGENANVAARPENKALAARLSKMLHEGWKAVRSPAREAAHAQPAAEPQ
jgi:iduronate 2-sulfatase